MGAATDLPRRRSTLRENAPSGSPTGPNQADSQQIRHLAWSTAAPASSSKGPGVAPLDAAFGRWTAMSLRVHPGPTG